MESAIRERIKQILRENSITESSFSKEIQMKQQTVNRQLKGESLLSSSLVESFLNTFPYVSSEWLLRGKGEVYLSELAEADGIPFYDRAIECGTPADFNACIEADKADGRIMLPNIQGDFALVAHGDSMVDAEHPDRSIPSGAIVVLRKVDEAAFIRWGEVYALATRDGFVIKRIMPLDGDNIECHSLNSVDFPPFRVCKSDIFGFARVVAVVNYRLY